MPIADLLQLKEQLGAKVYVSELTVCCDKQHFWLFNEFRCFVVVIYDWM